MEHFSLRHFITVAACFAITATAIALGRRWLARPEIVHLERRMVLGYVVTTMATQPGC